MSNSVEDNVDEGLPQFRSKRRKILHARRRTSPPSPLEHGPLHARDTENEGAELENHQGRSLIRKAKPVQHQSGIRYTATEPRPSLRTDMAVVPAAERQSATELARGRFAPGTGLVHHAADKYMYDEPYDQLSRLISNAPAEAAKDPATSGVQSNQPRMNEQDRSIHASGKLLEVDLSSPAETNRDRATATSRQQGASPGLNMQSSSRRRNPKQRAARDLARDSLVDAVLNETSSSYYDRTEPMTRADGGGDGEADERMAKQFEAEFMEQVEERNAMMEARMKQQQQAAKKAGQEPGKGPKMGGSRSARAAIHGAQKSAGGK